MNRTDTVMPGADAAGSVPYTRKPLLDDPQEFHFAVIGDRGGAERPGFFGKTMQALNLLRPEFTICVGDLMQGVLGIRDRDAMIAENKRQSDETDRFIGELDMRFFFVVGNHDIALGWPDDRAAHDVTRREWMARHGKTYYDFLYKGCHFVCLDSMDGRDGRLPVQGITDEQYAWARASILGCRDARWTFIFVHMPLDWTSDKWLAFEREINGLDYTVFCGDWHNHVKAVRHGKNYYMLGTCGGVYSAGVPSDDLRYGQMDAVTWVTVTKNGPVVANLQLSGIFDDTIQRCATTLGWMETPLDYPDHLTVADGLDEEPFDDRGYDWHFRHAMILRNDAFVVKPDLVLAGDGVMHRWTGADWYGDPKYPRPKELDAPFFRGHRVLNIGFAGDRNAHFLWRIRHGELAETTPANIILHIGLEDLRAGAAPEAVVEGILRNVRALHAAVSGAHLFVLAPLEQVPGREETAKLLAAALAGDGRAEFLDLAREYAAGGCAALETVFSGRLK